LKKQLPYEQNVSLYDTDQVLDFIAYTVNTKVGILEYTELSNFKAVIDAENKLVALVPPNKADSIIDLLNNIERYKND